MKLAQENGKVPIQAPEKYIAYAQCWEDADVLLEALDIQTTDTCLSISSGGDNTLAILRQSPAKVIAIDANPRQLACLRLKILAFKYFEWEEMLCFLGANKAEPEYRLMLYRLIRMKLPEEDRKFWDEHIELVKFGIIHAGKFERYFLVFRKYILPMIHGTATVDVLLTHKSQAERQRFYKECWNSLVWKILFNFFFSREIMGIFGRDRKCFMYVEGDIASKIRQRTEYALTALSPAENPYLHYILKHEFNGVLPQYLRKENFESIKRNLHKIDFYYGRLEDFLRICEPKSLDKLNLSDVFEYMSSLKYIDLLSVLTRVTRRGGRLVYWNMLADRFAPTWLEALRSLEDLALRLHAQDKAFFYKRLIVEEVTQ